MIYVIPIVCLLTIHVDLYEFDSMLKYIYSNDYLRTILLNQIQIWWNKEVKKYFLKVLYKFYNKYINNAIISYIKTIKQSMKNNLTNKDTLSHLIDKYLIPQENEKKKNAEVSTPYKLRQEMIGILEKNFFKSKKKVFEPCSGKGGFLIDIIDQFMKELDIPDEELKYKIIVEECLYFSDINPTNIFINKLLIEKNNK